METNDTDIMDEFKEKFTPSPWHVDYGEPEKRNFIRDKNGLIICEWWRSKHDAHLLASAPYLFHSEMYSLELLREMYARYSKIYDLCIHDEDVKNLLAFLPADCSPENVREIAEILKKHIEHIEIILRHALGEDENG